MAALVVVALGAAGWFVVQAVSGPSVSQGVVSLPNLPWPGAGQAAAEVWPSSWWASRRSVWWMERNGTAVLRRLGGRRA